MWTLYIQTSPSRIIAKPSLSEAPLSRRAFTSVPCSTRPASSLSRNSYLCDARPIARDVPWCDLALLALRHLTFECMSVLQVSPSARPRHAQNLGSPAETARGRRADARPRTGRETSALPLQPTAPQRSALPATSRRVYRVPRRGRTVRGRAGGGCEGSACHVDHAPVASVGAAAAADRPRNACPTSDDEARLAESAPRSDVWADPSGPDRRGVRRGETARRIGPGRARRDRAAGRCGGSGPGSSRRSGPSRRTARR